MLEHPHKKLNMANNACYPSDVGGRDKRVIILTLGSTKGLLERDRAGCPCTHMCIHNTERGRKTETHVRGRGREHLSRKRTVGEIKWLLCSPMDVLPTSSKGLSTLNPATPALGLVLSTMSVAWHCRPFSLCSFLFSLI